MDPAYERKEAVIVVNPAAHNVPKRERLREADTWLREAGWQATWEETAAPDHATAIAAKAAANRISLVLVCGGDGTLSEAANGLAGTATALGVIPAGTVNLWARELGMMTTPLKAVRLAVNGRRRSIDLGLAGSRYFMMLAGYGLDAAVTHHVSATLKRRFGATAYLVAAAREALRYRSSRLQLRLDGEERTADVLMLVAGNTRRYAGITQVTSQAEKDDGLLDVCVYTGRGTSDILMHAIRTLMQRHIRSRGVIYRRVSKLEIDWDRPLLVHLDGDACSESPTEVSVAPAALWVATPHDIKSSLFGSRRQPS